MLTDLFQFLVRVAFLGLVLQDWTERTVQRIMFAVHDRSVAGEGQDGKEHEDDELHSYVILTNRF